MEIRCLIVDDEPLSIRIVEKYIEDLPNLRISGTATNAFEAIEVLKNQRIDLIFLDINMPKLSGISLLKTLSHPPLVVFTTAYSEYAVDGFELDAVDFLLKPFSFERFVKAVQKVEEKLGQKIKTPSNSINKDFIIIKSDKKLYKVAYQSIVRLQAYGDYVKVYTSEKTLLTKERLSNLEAQLPSDKFIKIHRSHIIAAQRIQFLEGNLVNIEGEKLPISQTHREALLKLFNNTLNK